MIVSGQVALKVPRPGHGVAASALGVARESQLSIKTTPDGVVEIFSQSGSPQHSASDALLLGASEEEPCDEFDISGCEPPCQTNRHSINPDDAKVKRGQPWRFKASSTPNPLSNAYARSQIKAGTKTVINATNTCGLPDVVRRSAVYKGGTNAGTGMTVEGDYFVVCGGNGKNTVEFGKLPDFNIGWACTRTASRNGGRWFIVEGDIRLNKAADWTTAIDSPSCDGKYDIQSVMAHERAHTFGVMHAEGGEKHSQLTMYPSSYPCNSYGRTFGRGDHTALKKLY